MGATIMKISITGEKSVIKDLEKALAKDGVLGEALVDMTTDKTEQGLGLLEAAAIIAIVANTAKLIEYLVIIAKHLKSGEKQQLQVKTAVGTATVEIDRNSTAETLEKQVSNLAKS
jgi:hypothetical protein